MCGRYTLTITLEELLLRFHIDSHTLAAYRPRYNIAPMQMIPAVISDGRGLRLGLLRWGLVPSWASEERIGSKMINARAETLAQKPAFRELLRRKRCIIPADGFFEWKLQEAGKQPMRIVLKTGGPFAMAGLYDTWANAQGEKIHTCTVITTPANRLMADIHDRMPAILPHGDETAWLDRGIVSPASLLPLLQPYRDAELEAYPVAPLVGNVRNDTPECVRRLMEHFP